MKLPRRLSDAYRIAPGKSFRLKDWDPGDTARLDLDKRRAQALLQKGIEDLADLQTRLYAQDRWSILVVLQGMDAAGKDGTIKHVLSGLNPQGCEVHSFKAPSAEELDHDFLWRAARRLPERGRIGVFNRSHYEEVLVVRVHSELLSQEHLPAELVGKRIWKERYRSINDFERHLAGNGMKIVKFFLNVSKEEQRRRLLARLDDPEKRWKFSRQDAEERELWNEYQKAYEKAIRATSTRWAPWYVVPADHKRFTHLVVAETIVRALQELDLEFPKIDAPRRAEIETVRKALEKE